jgi:GH24 family phage-related lysozyme (muramidase)
MPEPLKDFPQLRSMLEEEEARKPKPYRDNSVGRYLTIGIGWNVDANPLPPDIAAHLKDHGEITDEMIERLLDISIEKAERACRRIWPDFDNFTDARRVALCDMVFNMGEGNAKRGMRSFRNALADIAAGKWASASTRFATSLWAKQVGSRRSKKLIDMIRLG